MLALKYQLPSDPSVYVDVVDDEDVSLMLDEWQEAAAAAGPGSSPGRLHIFVQWYSLLFANSSHLRPVARSPLLQNACSPVRMKGDSANPISDPLRVL